MKISVMFEYDEPSRKWEPRVSGVESELEARQAFAAVVLTCKELESVLLSKTKVERTLYSEPVYNIFPAVRS